MICTSEWYYLEGEGFSSEIIRVTKSNIQGYLSRGVCLLPWNDSMENHVVVIQLGFRDLHAMERLDVEYVDAASAIHESFIELIAINHMIDN